MPQHKIQIWSFWQKAGVLLAFSAVFCKILSLWRDRMFLHVFDPAEIDLIFAAFRVPDFFFFLLVAGTISTLFLPRAADVEKEKIPELFSSFFWGVVIFFGAFCAAGAVFAPFLVKVFSAGFQPLAQSQVASLAQILFASVFLLGVSAVFASALQQRQKFLALAAAPVFYAGVIPAGLFWLPNATFQMVGFLAVLGAGGHLVISASAFFINGGKIGGFWKRPQKSFAPPFWGDFWRRIWNNAAFQINQSADVLIASFLAAGSVAAFSIGTGLGHFLLSVLGLAAANAAFPQLTAAKNDLAAQRKILKKFLFWILVFSVPAAGFGAFFARELLQLFFGLSGDGLEWTQIVFFWTVLSLPAACCIPLLSRLFLANDRTSTPVKITTFSLFFATTLAAVLSLGILPDEKAIWGLAIGNFTANALSAALFGVATYFYLFRRRSRTSPKK